MPSPNWCHQVRIPTGKTILNSLSWRGDTLVDWAGGCATWEMDGKTTPVTKSWGYPMNAAITDASGEWALVHQRTGTAGVLLHQGQYVREIHRSLYHAGAFEFPACLFTREGRALLAHCPQNYAQIEIDDALSGERLTANSSRETVDFFHSRLQISPGGTRLLSAGWVWHPLNAAVWFDVAAALRDPRTLDVLAGATNSRNVSLTEESSAAWLDDEHVLLGGGSEEEDEEEAAEADALDTCRPKPNAIAVVDATTGKCSAVIPLGHPPGKMLAVGKEHVLTFFKHPKLVSLRSREVIHEWPEIDSGTVTSSIVTDQPYPVMALDVEHSRFAILGKEAIDVVQIDPQAL
jgi:hypothetical protein